MINGIMINGIGLVLMEPRELAKLSLQFQRENLILSSATSSLDECLAIVMPVRIMNTSLEDINMCAGTTIGWTHEICDVITINDNVKHRGTGAVWSCHVKVGYNSNVSMKPLHPVVDDLYQGISSNLTFFLKIVCSLNRPMIWLGDTSILPSFNM